MPSFCRDQPKCQGSFTKGHLQNPAEARAIDDRREITAAGAGRALSDFARPTAAFVQEEVVIYWNERTLAYDTRRSVRVPVAYDRFQDQKEFLGQH
jgi:hypothetical protein